MRASKRVFLRPEGSNVTSLDGVTRVSVVVVLCRPGRCLFCLTWFMFVLQFRRGWPNKSLWRSPRPCNPPGSASSSRRRTCVHTHTHTSPHSSVRHFTYFEFLHFHVFTSPPFPAPLFHPPPLCLLSLGSLSLNLSLCFLWFISSFYLLLSFTSSLFLSF